MIIEFRTSYYYFGVSQRKINVTTLHRHLGPGRVGLRIKVSQCCDCPALCRSFSLSCLSWNLLGRACFFCCETFHHSLFFVIVEDVGCVVAFAAVFTAGEIRGEGRGGCRSQELGVLVRLHAIISAETSMNDKCVLCHAALVRTVKCFVEFLVEFELAEQFACAATCTSHRRRRGWKLGATPYVGNLFCQHLPVLQSKD